MLIPAVTEVNLSTEAIKVCTQEFHTHKHTRKQADIGLSCGVEVICEFAIEINIYLDMFDVKRNVPMC